MDLGNNIYIITSGDYSDYSIEAVFSTREKAEEYLQYHDDEYRIEEYELDKDIEREEGSWMVRIGLSDNKVRVEKHFSVFKDSILMNTVCLKETKYSMKKNTFFVTWVWTDTKDRAIKIARERLVAARSNEVVWLRLQLRNDKGEYLMYKCYTNEIVSL